MRRRVLKIDFLANERHFVDHLAPVWNALSREYRGAFYVSPSARERAAVLHIPFLRGRPPSGDYPTLVAAVGDLRKSVKLGRPSAIMEHGAGFSFGGDENDRAATGPSYAGGRGREAELFLHPGPHPAARDAAAYPKARVEIVGCTKLDTLPRKEIVSVPPVVAVSVHWDCGLCEETRSAFVWVREHIPSLKKAGFEVLGHGHPRIFDRLEPWYRRRGIEPVRDFDEVCRRADVYVCDGSSTIYEFAATGRPVVVLDPPFYRRDVNHGLRFWDAADVGVRISEPSEIVRAVRLALDTNPMPRAARDAARERALDMVYGYRTGAAERAARVLEDWVRTRA